ncbi:MAG: carboxypeptidase M32, partial [Phycisphaerales bacterium]|nr:carboxypeptidase M32 [Phycisphaerales bacterium]
MNSTYETFLKLTKDISTAYAIESLLDWDQETYMPKRAAPDRAEQAAFMAGLAHERLTSDEYAGLIERLEPQAAGDDHVVATNVREMTRRYKRAARLPKSLVEEIARATSLAKDEWAQARKAADFARFAPHLEKLIDLKRQVADRVGWNTEPYDALMDEFEPGAQAAQIQAVFDKLKTELVPLVAAIASAPRKPDTALLAREFPRAAQEQFGRRICEAMGFDFEAGRIDVSTHPFCSGRPPFDVRLTTRYDERYLPMSLFGTMHEAGHGLYEQGLDAAHRGTPMAQSVSLGIHESQSRMWENLVGRSREFWQHFYPALQAAFPSLVGVALNDWHFAINTVRPSFIRVEADEVTYTLHIILRFNVERQLIAGKLAVKDVPAAWNASMKDLLGITPGSDAEGCLQDIHWSLGIFGYFPTYALGNLYASQFFASANRAMPTLRGDIASGN